MTTLDELTKVYADAEFRRQGAGIAAVVRAMRDEFTIVRGEHQTILIFDGILGDAGDAAGAPPGNPEGRDGTTGSATAAIAVATPAAAFCEWAGSKAFVGKRKRGCNGNVVLATPEFGVLEGGPCAYCGKPIRFKETP